MKRIGLILLFVGSSVCLLSQNPENNKSTTSDSKVVDTIIHSVALENNFLGDSPERNLLIYLPPGYDETTEKYYPVIYFLHSYAVDHTAFFGGYPWYTINFKTICDDLIASGEIDPMIIVSPNSYNKYWGSFYTNSFVTGNWEDFIVDDVINYVDNNFRTLAQKESRGLAGHSMGGYGTIWLTMNNPDVYNAAYMLSGQVENEELNLVNGRANMIEAVNAESLDGLHWLTVVRIAQAAAVAPDTFAPPFYAQFPLDTSGAHIDSIWQKWLQHDPLYLLPSYKDSLLKLKAIQFDVGTKDESSGFINGNIKLSEALNDLGIEHSFEQYPGTHDNMLSRRIKTKLLPFFSSTLSKNLLSDTVPIPDTAFLYALIDEGVDTNGDSLISYAEAESVVCLDVSGKIDSCYAASPVCCSTPVSAGNIHSLSGIEEFINLDTLICSGNQITTLDLSENIQLKYLDVRTNGAHHDDNGLRNLNVQQCSLLTYLDISWTQLDYIDLSQNTHLKEIIIEGYYGNINFWGHLVLNVWETFLSDSVYIDSVFITRSCAGAYEVISNISFEVNGNPITSNKEQVPNSVLVYPNPAEEILFLEQDNSYPISIKIFSINGVLIRDITLRGYQTHQLDLSSFESGVYFITIRSKGFIETRKIIKL